MLNIKKLLVVVGIILCVLIGLALSMLDNQIDTGRMYEGRQQYDQAIDMYNKAADAAWTKNDPYVYLRRAYCKRQTNRLEEAHRDLDKASELMRQPSISASWNQLFANNSMEHRINNERAWTYYKQNQLDNALETFEVALQKEKSIGAYTGEAAVFEALKKYPEAEKAYENALSVAKNSCDRENVYHERGIYFRNIGETKQAIRDFTTAKETEACPGAYYERALLLRKSKDKEDLKMAISDLTRAQQLSPYQEKYFHTRAQMLMEQGDYKTALDDINNALQLDPDCKAAAEDKVKIEAKLVAQQKK